MKINVRLLSIFNLSLMAALIAVGCSNPGDEVSSVETASQAQVGEAGFQILSSSFTEVRPKKRIPEENTCYGENLSPSLTWSGTPSGTNTFALVSEDVDHHTGIPWTHWVMYNIPVSVTELTEGIPTSTAELLDGSVQGKNDFNNIGYEGPCPLQVEVSYWPSVEGRAKLAKGAHKYVFTLYALDTVISLPPASTKEQLIGAMDKHILDQTDTVGKFQAAPIHRNKLAPEGETTTVQK